MIVVRLKGGLGNQMFQYAFGYSLSRSLDRKLFLDITYFNKINFDTKRNYELDGYPIVYEDLIIKNNIFSRVIDRVSALNISEKNFNVLNFNDYRSSKKIILDGYWQSEDYFREFSGDIRKFFSGYKSKNAAYTQLRNEIRGTNSTSLHVRRGDYVTNIKASLVHQVCGLEYFMNAIKIVEKGNDNTRFFVFTDDIEWVGANLKDEKFRIVSAGNMNHFDELSLMSHCQNNVIANSSYSWWAAWLNPNENKKIVAPRRWFKNNLNTIGLIPPNWITV